MIIDHIGLGVGDYDRAKEFYSTVLQPLGLAMLMEVEEEDGVNTACGLGRREEIAFGIRSEGAARPRVYVAFTAKSRSGLPQA